MGFSVFPVGNPLRLGESVGNGFIFCGSQQGRSKLTGEYTLIAKSRIALLIGMKMYEILAYQPTMGFGIT
jgi:hypothetical protein